MLGKGIIGAAASALLLTGSIAAPAFAADGVTRNQAALGVAGHATPAMKACAKVAKNNVRARCAVSNGASQFQDDSDTNRGAGTWIVAAGAAAAIALGIVAATSGDDDADGTPTPVSS